MDDIVKAAMAKWPNVPHCYGWLALDARGHWRMRDETAQHQNSAGDKIVHAALLAFINRNYLHDAEGRWYFQNGPQRVYVNLDATPFIARTETDLSMVLHTGDVVESIEAAWLTEDGQLVLQSAGRIAMLDDRDMTQAMALLECDGQRASDEALLLWLAYRERRDRDERGARGEQTDAPQLSLRYRDAMVELGYVARSQLAQRFGFVSLPLPNSAS